MKVDKGVCTNDADSDDCSDGTNTPRLFLAAAATDENFYRGAAVAQRYGAVFTTLLENKILAIKRETAAAEQRKRKQKFRRKKIKSPEAIDGVLGEGGTEIVLHDGGDRIKATKGRADGKRGMFCIKRNSMTETDLVTIAAMDSTRKCDENMHSKEGGGSDPSTKHTMSPPRTSPPVPSLPLSTALHTNHPHVTHEPTVCELNIMLNEHLKQQQHELAERSVDDDVDMKNCIEEVVETETMVEDNKANIHDNSRRYHQIPPPPTPPIVDDDILQDVLIIRPAAETTADISFQSLHERRITFKRNETSSPHSSIFGGIKDDILEEDLPTLRARKCSTTETTFSYPSSVQGRKLPPTDLHSPRMLLDHERHRLRLLEAKSISAQCSPIFSRALRSCSTQSEMIDTSVVSVAPASLRLLHRQYTSDDSAGAMTFSSTVDEEDEKDAKREYPAAVVRGPQPPSTLVISKFSNKHDKVDRPMMMMTMMSADRRQNIDNSTAVAAAQGFISNFNQITSNNINLNLPVITTTTKKRSGGKSDRQSGTYHHHHHHNRGSENYGNDTSADGSQTINDDDGMKRYRKKCSKLLVWNVILMIIFETTSN